MKSKILQLNIALVLAIIFTVGGLWLPTSVPLTFAQQGETLILRPSGPSYVKPGGNITYELTLTNYQNQPITDITVWNPLPANTTYVSGGTLFQGDNGVAFYLTSLAANSSHTFNLVVKVGSGVAIGTVIENKNVVIESFTTGGNSFSRPAENAVGTTVEAPGTVVAIYKNASGRAFDVTIDSYKFQNYGADGPRVSADDLSTADMFALFGPAVCQSGRTAATCILSGPARKWMESSLAIMGGGHCEGMAATSLRLFNSLPFKGKSSPATFQTGATKTSDLNFPAQTIENYVGYYFITQLFGEVQGQQYHASAVELVNKLIADFNAPTPIAYTVSIFLVPGFRHGHAVTAYGVEKVTNSEYRILIYDNNFPKQRKYITVNMTNNTWRYVTASTPGETPDIYTGTADSGNIWLTPNRSRDLAAGKYFYCDFCNAPVSSARSQPSATDQISGTLSVQYSGEGAILVVNDAGQATGDDHQSATFVNQIPNAQVYHYQGGLGKEMPPRIVIPFTEVDETYYTVIVHGKSVITPTSGSLTLVGSGFALGLKHIGLDPQELFEFSVSPDGDHISFDSTEAITAPGIYISHDPIDEGDPSVIFDIEGVTLLPGERVSLDLDPVLERIHFADTGANAENFTVTMLLIWPDGEEEIYTDTVHMPAGTTSAFIDFGAWDGLKEPALYIDNVLQNGSVNHRLKMTGMKQTYFPAQQPNASFGVSRLEATFTNVTQISLETISLSVTKLGAGNMLLNAQGGPAGVGGTVVIPASALGADGILDVNESFTAYFDVGLGGPDTTDLVIEAKGAPHDWRTVESRPAYDAPDTNYAFVIRASNPTFLPMLTK